MVHLDTNIFSFSFIYFSWFNISFLLILFYFIFIDDEEAHDCGHMTYHMMWGHRPRLGKSGLEE